MRLKQLIITFTILVLACLRAQADNQTEVLIINSFSDDSPWIRNISYAINSFMFQHESVRCIEENLNCIFVETKEDYQQRNKRFFERLSNYRPDAIIMIGGFALLMRDDIREKWGDVPILIINRINRYAPLPYYLSGFEGASSWDLMPSIQSLQDKYNLTLIELPDQFINTLKLMLEIFPKTQSIKFISDGLYFNRSINATISQTLNTDYPQLRYEWLKISANTVEQSRDIVREYQDNTVALISTWRYKLANDYGGQMLMTDEQSLISGTRIPIFAMRQPYLEAGALGGVINDRKQLNEALVEDMTLILNGEPPRDIPFKYIDQTTIVINYPVAERFGVNFDHCPDNTLFINRPASVWEKHKWIFILASLVFTLTIVILGVFLVYQRRLVKSLRSHQSLISNIPVPYAKAYVKTDSDGHIVSMTYDKNKFNPSFLQLVNDNSPQHNVDDIITDFVISSDSERLLNSNRAVTFSQYFKATDSSYVFNICRVGPKIDVSASGKSEYRFEIDIFASNVTDLTQTWQTLQSTANTLEVTLKVATIIPWQWDLETHTIKWTPQYLKLHKSSQIATMEAWTRENATEELLLQRVHPDDYQKLKDMFDGYHAGAIISHSMEFRLRFGEGEHQTEEWVEIHSMLTNPTDGDVSKMVFGSLMFITERKRQEKELIDANKRALESDRLKSEFLASMSHEIRTPLNAITGFSTLIMETEDPEDRERFRGIVEENTQMLISIISDVLDLAKIESNSLDYHIHDFELNQVFYELRNQISKRIQDDVKLNLIVENEELWIHTDDQRVRQVLFNLLSNAAKFTVKGNITFGYEVIDNEICMFVRDTGIGIDLADQEAIFERFKKLDTFSQGTGIGLTISRQIVKDLGGSMGLKSEGQGKGSEFWFTLPYCPVQQ